MQRLNVQDHVDHEGNIDISSEVTLVQMYFIAGVFLFFNMSSY